MRKREREREINKKGRERKRSRKRERKERKNCTVYKNKFPSCVIAMLLLQIIVLTRNAPCHAMVLDLY